MGVSKTIVAGHGGRDLPDEVKIKICRVVGVLLLIDGVFTSEEEQFLRQLMDRFELDERKRESVFDEIRVDADYSQDVEFLRRRGQANLLLNELGAAALSDGDFARPERAMIARVRRIIQYRLGTDQYFLPLDHLDHSPLNELYEDLDLLDEGAFSSVFKARSRSTSRTCVIKKLRGEFDQEVTAETRASLEDRFWREVSLIGRLQSPYTVRLLGAGFDVDTPYMVLEHLDGETLRSLLQRRALAPKEAQHLMRCVLDAVAEAHDYGIVHRDLKPENIMVMGDELEVVKVLDFGISGMVDVLKDEQHFTITIPQQLLGTPPYMAPEQILEIGVARRESDIYSLGLILCECVTGVPVYQGTPYRILHQQLACEAVPLPEEIEHSGLGPVIRRACQKKWYDRFGPSSDQIEQIQAAESKSLEIRQTLEREIYHLYSPADEMLEALGEVVLEEEPGQQRQSFFNLLRRVLAKPEESSATGGVQSTRVAATKKDLMD